MGERQRQSQIRENLRFEFKELERMLPPKEKLQGIISELLKEREGIESKVRSDILAWLYQLTEKAATFGLGAENLKVSESGFDERILPPIASSTLIDFGILDDEKKAFEISLRQKHRLERRGLPAENNLKIQVLGPKQIQTLPVSLSRLPRPILGIRECYTRTLPTSGVLEINVTGNYILGKDSKEELYFLGESMEDPHSHVYNPALDKWFRIDKTSHPDDFSIPSELLESIPPLQKPRDDFLATNEQIATIMVLFWAGIRQES